MERLARQALILAGVLMVAGASAQDEPTLKDIVARLEQRLASVRTLRADFEFKLASVNYNEPTTGYGHISFRKGEFLAIELVASERFDMRFTNRQHTIVGFVLTDQGLAVRHVSLRPNRSSKLGSPLICGFARAGTPIEDSLRAMCHALFIDLYFAPSHVLHGSKLERVKESRHAIRKPAAAAAWGPVGDLLKVRHCFSEKGDPASGVRMTEGYCAHGEGIDGPMDYKVSSETKVEGVTLPERVVAENDGSINTARFELTFSEYKLNDSVEPPYWLSEAVRIELPGGKYTLESVFHKSIAEEDLARLEKQIKGDPKNALLHLQHANALAIPSWVSMPAYPFRAVLAQAPSLDLQEALEQASKFGKDLLSASEAWAVCRHLYTDPDAFSNTLEVLRAQKRDSPLLTLALALSGDREEQKRLPSFGGLYALAAKRLGDAAALANIETAAEFEQELLKELHGKSIDEELRILNGLEAPPWEMDKSQRKFQQEPFGTVAGRSEKFLQELARSKAIEMRLLVARARTKGAELESAASAYLAVAGEPEWRKAIADELTTFTAIRARESDQLLKSDDLLALIKIMRHTDPDDLTALEWEADCHMARGESSDAVPLYERWLERALKSKTFGQRLSPALEDIGNLDALEAYQFGKDDPILVKYASARVQLKEAAKGAEFLANRPRLREDPLVLARAFELLGAFDSAAELYRRVLFGNGRTESWHRELYGGLTCVRAMHAFFKAGRFAEAVVLEEILCERIEGEQLIVLQGAVNVLAFMAECAKKAAAKLDKDHLAQVALQRKVLEVPDKKRQVIAKAVEALSSDDPRLRGLARERLKNMGPDYASFLSDASRNADLEVRTWVAQTLAEWGKMVVREQLLKIGKE